jgi:hypothetical protein
VSEEEFEGMPERVTRHFERVRALLDEELADGTASTGNREDGTTAAESREDDGNR